MFITVKSNYPKLSKLSIKLDASTYIILYPKKADEQLLDKYLWQNYKVQLVPICLKILNNLKISLNDTNELVITIPNKQLNKFARIITYGTGKIKGSDILKFAIKQGGISDGL